MLLFGSGREVKLAQDLAAFGVASVLVTAPTDVADADNLIAIHVPAFSHGIGDAILPALPARLLTASDLFARVEQSPTARAIVEQHARDVGNLAAACVSVLDPQLIVLGGGVGQNPLLLPGVRDVVKQLCWPVEVVMASYQTRRPFSALFVSPSTLRWRDCQGRMEHQPWTSIASTMGDAGEAPQ